MTDSPQNPDAGTRLPRPRKTGAFANWTVPVAGLAAVSLLAVTSGVLMWRYMSSRPLNLAPANAAMAGHIEDLLTMSHLPPDAIRRYEPVAKENETAHWTEYAFDVVVPPAMSAQSIQTTLQHGMALQNVSIELRETPDNTQTDLHFSMMNHPFAVVRIMGGAERYELTAASDELAEGVRAALAQAPFITRITKSSTQARQDGPVRWRSCLMEAFVQPTIRPEHLAQYLARSLPEIQGELPKITPEPARNAVDVFWRGLPVVRIALAAGIRMFDDPAPDFLANPGLIYEACPVFFRSVFGFDPEAPALSRNAQAGARQDAPEAPPQSNTNGDPPRAAIIVDDGGYGGLVSDAILTMDTRLTLAILPGTPFARETAESALARGFEIMVHMPLESGNGEEVFPGELTTAMNEQEIQERLDAALEEVTGAKGLNNHTGSKFTADNAAMTRLLESLKKRGLFYVDSRTTADTVAETIARQLEVPVARRAVFLDNESAPDYIRAQVAELAETARSQGSAIGICHFRSTTAAMLPEIVGLLESHGVSLVHASELVQ